MALSVHFTPGFLCQCSVIRVFKAKATQIRRKLKQMLESPRIKPGISSSEDRALTNWAMPAPVKIMCRLHFSEVLSSLEKSQMLCKLYNLGCCENVIQVINLGITKLFIFFQWLCYNFFYSLGFIFKEFTHAELCQHCDKKRAHHPASPPIAICCVAGLSDRSMVISCVTRSCRAPGVSMTSYASFLCFYTENQCWHWDWEKSSQISITWTHDNRNLWPTLTDLVLPSQSFLYWEPPITPLIFFEFSWI